MEALTQESSMPETREVMTRAGLEALRDEWTALWSNCEAATPFQTPEWLIPWWNHFGNDQLLCIEIRQEGVLIGLAPLYVQLNRETNEREVLFVGNGITDCHGALAAPGFEQQVIAAVLNWLDTHRDEWELCDFQQLRGQSSLPMLPDGYLAQITVQEVCPVLTLPPVVSELARHVPRTMLQKLAYYRRKLEKHGGSSIEVADPLNFQELFTRFFALHQARWSSRGERGVLADTAVQNFHWEAAEGLLRAGLLRLYGLRIDGEIAATLYAFTGSARTCFYLSGFDPAFGSFSPGAVLVGHAIEQAILEGVHEFDFLRGREAYKYIWGARGHLNYRWRIWRE